MNPIIDQKFFLSLQECDLALDTCCLIDAVKDPQSIGKFLNDLKDKKNGFLTVPVVVHEFMRGVDSEESLITRKEFLEKFIDSTYPVDRYLNGMTDFLLIMNKVCSCDLGEFQLIATLIKHPGVYLVTENHRHIPTDFIDRVSVVTFNLPKEIKTYGFYRFNAEKYEKIAANIIKSTKKN